MPKTKDYQLIYADPAWIYNDKSKSHGGGAESHYKCTSTKEMGEIITKINIAKDAICLMWCTYPQIKEGLKLMKLWGFKYKTVAFTWVKKNKKANTYFFGMGRYTRGNPEIVLLGRKGKGLKRRSAKVKNLQIHKIREHSRKPDEIRIEIEKLFGEVNKIELFARERIQGWDSFGDELPKHTQKILENAKN